MKQRKTNNSKQKQKPTQQTLEITELQIQIDNLLETEKFYTDTLGLEFAGKTQHLFHFVPRLPD